MIAGANEISSGAVGAVYLCAIGPTILVKLTAPYWWVVGGGGGGPRPPARAGAPPPPPPPPPPSPHTLVRMRQPDPALDSPTQRLSHPTARPHRRFHLVPYSARVWAAAALMVAAYTSVALSRSLAPQLAGVALVALQVGRHSAPMGG